MSEHLQPEKSQATGSKVRSTGTPALLLTAKEVAGLTGLSMETLAQWRSQERGIPFVKISRNCVRYQQSDLDMWIQERIVRPAQDDEAGGRA
jgi:predicted DNA-binding transcriptional regulator AlpA